MAIDFDDKEEDEGWYAANAVYLIAGLAIAVLFIAGAVAFWMFGDTPRELPRRPAEIVVNLLPPPPPKQTPPPEQKMIEAVKPTDAPDRPEEPMKEPPPPDMSSIDQPPPGPLSIDAAAEVPSDAFNLGSKVGGRGLLSGGGGGSAEGRYSALMIRELKALLERNEKIKSAQLEVQLKYWLDDSGRMTRLVLAQSTGNADLDATIKAVLANLAFSQPPPKSIPMPITTRVSVQRPS